MSKKLEISKKRILYRASYRGTKEMDILLGAFVKKYIDQLNSSELKDLENFLEFEDEIIFNYYKFNKFEKGIEKNEISKLFRVFKI